MIAQKIPMDLVREVRRSDQAATFWLGQVKAAQAKVAAAEARAKAASGDSSGAATLQTVADQERAAAINYFKNFEHNLWRGSVDYNLARIYEEQGQLAEAIELYRLDESPQRTGNLLRARRLEAEMAKPDAKAEVTNAAVR